MLRYAPIAAVVLHTCLVLLTVCVVADDHGNGESAMMWNAFMMLDFPSSLLMYVGALLPLEWCTIRLQDMLGALVGRPVSGFAVSYLIVAPTVFAISGGVQYYYLTKIVCKIHVKRSTRRDKASSCP